MTLFILPPGSNFYKNNAICDQKIIKKKQIIVMK